MSSDLNFVEICLSSKGLPDQDTHGDCRNMVNPFTPTIPLKSTENH